MSDQEKKLMDALDRARSQCEKADLVVRRAKARRDVVYRRRTRVASALAHYLRCGIMPGVKT